MTATALEFTPVSVPQDDPPITESPNGAFNPEYPDSTPEAPYGYKADGTPYRRRPKGTANRGTTASKMPASESLARSAAGLLKTVNTITAAGLTAWGFPLTGTGINNANDQFEELAYNALLADPALCKKILGAGAQGGKAALAMAYGMLIMSIIPAMKTEIAERRALRATDEGEENEHNEH